MPEPEDDRNREFLSPLGLVRRLEKPDTLPDTPAIATVLASALMLTVLVGSRFVFAPGVTVGLGSDETVALTLPVATMGRLPGARTEATLTVLALKQDDMAVWNGRIRTMDALAEDFPPSATRRGVLLLKADGSVSMNTFVRVLGLARRAGYSAVQIAAEERK